MSPGSTLASSPARSWRVPPALRGLSYHWVSFLRTWRADIGTTIVAPFLYLASLGAGLGGLIGHGHAMASLGGVDYMHFVAPALLAANAMQVALSRATYAVFGQRRFWSGAYRSMQASPITLKQIVTAEMSWVAARCAIATSVYLAVSAAFGTIGSGEAVLCLLVGPLIGLAFAAPISAFSITLEHDHPLVLIFRLLMLPLFLFSGTFFPVSQLPTGLRYVAYGLPLWHGVELCRGAYLGTLSLAGSVGHIGYLVGMAGIGTALARYSFGRALSY
ncbi:MAG TPA: ABC transporter permease [Acidimicrobiales bacterium]|nr:ABC transporter permease [Acidimicrobiales bacterium]